MIEIGPNLMQGIEAVAWAICIGSLFYALSR